MKKFYILLALGLTTSLGFAQSQRIVLFEEFTGENCGPCAQTNPALNKLLQTPGNETKVISIKYQVPIPSAGPIYNAYKVPSDARRSYYGVNSAPNGRQDGKLFAQETTAPGHPGYYSQQIIDAGAAKPASMDLNVTHRLSANYDSIYVHVEGKLTADITGTNKLRVAVIENKIVFDKAPGTNGEKVFEEVCREMLPNAAGTAVTVTSKDETFSQDFAWKLKYIYDISEIAVVAFVQNDLDKSVYQTNKSNPIALQLDAQAAKVANVKLYECVETLNAKFELKNTGVDAITSCEANYKLDAGTAVPFSWTGNLAAGASVLIDMPQITAANGSHQLVVSIDKINNTTDANVNNNKSTVTLNILTQAAPAPFIEEFKSTTFPGNNMFVNNPDGGDTWIQGTGAGGFKVGGAEKAAKILTYYATPGEKDELYFPKVNLTALGSDKAFISFDYAHCSVTGSTGDKLELQISNDCGASWTTVSSISGQPLYTAPATNSFYVPKATEWVRVSKEVPTANASELMMRFVTTANQGNFLWLDNVNVTKEIPAGINKENPNFKSLSIFPNPTSDELNIEMSLRESATVSVEVLNLLGEQMSTEDFGFQAAGNQNVKLNLNKFAAGMYVVRIKSGEFVSHHNISVVK